MTRIKPCTRRSTGIDNYAIPNIEQLKLASTNWSGSVCNVRGNKCRWYIHNGSI